jgi:hypothetical protein
MKPSESPRVKARPERNSNDHRCERSWDELAQYFEPIVWAMTLAPADRPWFALCGAIPASGAGPFLIGAGARLRLPAGRLLCFANDVPGFYWNNFGAVILTVELVHAPESGGSL